MQEIASRECSSQQTDLQLDLNSAAEQAVTGNLLHLHDSFLIQGAHSEQLCFI